MIITYAHISRQPRMRGFLPLDSESEATAAMMMYDTVTQPTPRLKLNVIVGAEILLVAAPEADKGFTGSSLLCRDKTLLLTENARGSYTLAHLATTIYYLPLLSSRMRLTIRDC